jgi:hypothetical protein
MGELFDLFAPALATALDKSSGIDMNAFLFTFRSEMVVSRFKGYSPAGRLASFTDIWRLFLQTACDSSSSIRLAAFRAASAFLTRLLPYFPEAVHRSFADAVLQTAIDIKSSALVAAAFTLLSSRVAKPYLRESLHSLPVFHHFTSTEPTFADQFPIIISKLGHVGNDWLKYLLQFFLKRIVDESAGYILMKSAAAIVAHFPPLFLKEVLEFIGGRIQNYLLLLAFLIGKYGDCVEGLDLLDVALAAVVAVGDEKSVPGDADSALQLLAVRSDSFELEVSGLDEGFLTLRVWKGEKSATGRLLFESVSGRPSVYRIPLPYSLLVPRETDSASILQAKFRTLGTIEAFDPVEVFGLLRQFASKRNMSASSGAVTALAYSANRFLGEVPYEQVYELLRTVLLRRSTSVQHSDEVLKVIQGIDVSLLRAVMGSNFVVEVLEVVVKLCFSTSEDLAAGSLRVLRHFVSEATYEPAINLISSNCDFFDAPRLIQTIEALVVVLRQINRRFVAFDVFAESLAEAAFFYLQDLTTMSSIFGFFTLYCIPPLKISHLVAAAKNIVTISFEVIKGRSFRFVGFRETLAFDILNRNVDILVSPSQDYQGFLHPMRQALNFIFSLPGTVFAMARRSLRLMPSQASRYIRAKWMDIRDDQKLKLLSEIPERLHYIGDDDVHATWCQIYLDNPELFCSSLIAPTTDFLNQMAVHLLLNSSRKNIPFDVIFATFLLHFDENVVLSYLRSSSAKDRFVFFDRSPSMIPLVEKSAPELVRDYEPGVPSRPEMPRSSSNLESLAKDDLQSVFEQSARQSNLRKIRQILKIATEKQFFLDVTRITFPPPVIPVVAAALCNTQPNSFHGRRALELVRTAWRPLVIPAVAPHINKLLEDLMTEQKIHKRTILDLCSVVHAVEFDPNLLLKLALHLYSRSETTHRFYVTSELMMVTLSIVKNLPSGFLLVFAAAAREKMALLYPPAMAVTFLTLLRIDRPTSELVALMRASFGLCIPASGTSARLHQSIFSVSQTGNWISPSYLAQLPQILFPFLYTDIPSLYLSGLLLFEEAVISLPAALCSVGLKVPLNEISSRFIRMSGYPFVAEYTSRVIIALLSKGNVAPLHFQLFKSMPNSFLLGDYKAGYGDSLRFWPPLVRMITVKSLHYRQVMRTCEQLVRQSHAAFEMGLKSLKERLQRDGKANRDVVLTDIIRLWINVENQSRDYKTVDRIDAWFDFVIDVDPSLLHVVTLEFVRRIRPFSAVFVSFARVFARNKGKDFLDGIRSASMCLEKKCQRMAVMLLDTCRDWTKLAELAQFEDDCQESEQLLNTLMDDAT